MNTGENTFPLIEVSGTSCEMGYQHGVQARQLVRNYLKWIEKMTGEPRELLCNCAMAFLPMFENLSVALVDEIRGLAKGADISFEEALLCQTRHEVAKAHGGGCTAFAITGSATADGNTIIGQNEDMRPEFSDITILLHVKPTDERPRALMVTCAGQLGHQGMNEYGVAHLINGLHSLDLEFRRAMFRYPLNRIMLEKRTVEECVSLLEQNRTCSAFNKVICDGQGSIADVEVRPGGVAIFTAGNIFESHMAVKHEQTRKRRASHLAIPGRRGQPARPPSAMPRGRCPWPRRRLRSLQRDDRAAAAHPD